jgi:hypothetical protein
MIVARELTTAGARTAYLPESLPALFEDQEPTDFSGPTYENLRNSISGLAAIFDRHVRQAAAVESDPQWQDSSAPHRQERISEALAAVSAEALKGVERLERVADSAEKEAAGLRTGLTTPDPLGAAAATILTSHQELPREKQVVRIHELSHLVANPDTDPAERAVAREYLNALAATDPSQRLLDETSRKIVEKALARSKDPAKYQRERHLALASRAIKESAARVRKLIERR